MENEGGEYEYPAGPGDLGKGLNTATTKQKAWDNSDGNYYEDTAGMDRGDNTTRNDPGPSGENYAAIHDYDTALMVSRHGKKPPDHNYDMRVFGK